MAIFQPSTFVTLNGQLGPPAIYIVADAIILLEAIHGLIYILRKDSASRSSEMMNKVYIALAPTLLISDYSFFSNHNWIIIAKLILQDLVTSAQQIREAIETQPDIEQDDFRRGLYLLRVPVATQAIGIILQYAGFSLSSNLRLVGFLTSRVRTCFRYGIVALCYFKAFRRGEDFDRRMSDAFFTAWSALAAMTGFISLILGLVYLFHRISFDTLLLNQIELSFYSSSLLPVIIYTLIRFISSVRARHQRFNFLDNSSVF